MSNWNRTGTTFAVLLAVMPVATAQDDPLLGFGGFTNPSVTVSYEQAPTAGVQFQELTFADAITTCAQRIVDGTTQRLLAEGINVSDRQDLRNLQTERRLQDVGLRGLQVSTAMVVVSASRCLPDLSYSKKSTKYLASTSYNIQGSIRLINVSTGRVLLAEPIKVNFTETNDSYKGYPDYPPTVEVERRALDEAVEKVSAVLTTTRPKAELLFFNDKSCGLKDGHRLVVGGDIEGALHFLQESLESCKATSSKKTKLIARAHHNVGVLQIMLGDHENAHRNLQAAVQLHDGPYIKQAFNFSIKAQTSTARVAEVEARTREMNEQLARAALSPPPAQAPAPSPPAPAPSQAAQDTASPIDQLAERLKKLEALFKAGLITKEDYDAKKAEILSEL